MFKLTSSFSSWPSEAYQVCMIKFIALRFFLLNCKVIPKVWVRVYTKKWRLNFEISKILSICLYDQWINWGKKIKLSPIQREKKWNEYWQVTSKRKGNITKSHVRLPFHHYTAFSDGMSLFWTTLFDTLRSNITFARSAGIRHDHISNSLFLVSLEYALIQSSYVPFCSLVFSSPFFLYFYCSPISKS